MTLLYIAIAAVAYLLGSIPFGYILVRLFLKRDIRSTGSGNIGATNVARSGTKGLGILTLLLDVLKGFVAVSIAHLLTIHEDNRHALAIAAVFAILGHVFPVWLKFKGGKGVATGLGVFLAIAPQAVLISLGVFILVFAISRFVSLASMVSAGVFPAAAYLLDRTMSHSLLLGMCFVSVLIIVKHQANIGRLRHGTEPRFGSKKAALPRAMEPGS